jgi:hypothetical protein
MLLSARNPRGKLLILLIRARVRVQANLSVHYFLLKKGSGIKTTTGSLLGYEGRGSNLISCCCYEYMGARGVGIAIGRT